MIGYAPYSEDLKAPGDRRRFVFYARHKKIDYEIADVNKSYDLVYITSSANISSWIEYKKRNKTTKLIFEMVDAYTFYNDLSWNLGRGLYRFIQGRENKYVFFYKNIYKKIFEVADAVVCNTKLQKDHIINYNKNVHISLDFFTEDINQHKVSYNISKPLSLVWEGLSYTVKNILEIRDVLEKIEDIHLKIITNPVIPLGKSYKRNTSELFKKCKFSYQIIPWEIETFTKEIAEADLAIIPINKKHKLQYHKPENKLILFWEIGIPVLTSDTPAYKQVFSQIKSDLTCSNKDEWREKLEMIKLGKFDLRDHMVKAKKYIQTYHSESAIIENWDNIFRSV
jgi:hypothetical protein